MQIKTLYHIKVSLHYNSRLNSFVQIKVIVYRHEKLTSKVKIN